MEIIFTKEGMRIIHSTGVNQFLTLADLYILWNEAKAEEKRAEENSEEIHKYITEVEKHL
ncbi:unnamed protein product [marine sediment metagenome]|uniref:Uncharacterized protein n=1 Tax=marine sediment metagenome TaxID=412755 RepID=X1FKA2_9ZZZZ